MRYIIAENIDGHRLPFLGLAPVTHKNLAEMAAQLGYRKPTSGGFAHLGPALGVTTHYRSESLGLIPDQDDARIIHVHYRCTLDLVPDFQMKPRPRADDDIPHPEANSVQEHAALMDEDRLNHR